MNFIIQILIKLELYTKVVIKTLGKDHKSEELENVKEKFNLPEDFLLNGEPLRLEKSYFINKCNVPNEIDIPLVVAGKKLPTKIF